MLAFFVKFRAMAVPICLYCSSANLICAAEARMLNVDGAPPAKAVRTRGAAGRESELPGGPT